MPFVADSPSTPSTGKFVPDGPSPYSAEGMAASAQAAVQARAERLARHDQEREEENAPHGFLSINPKIPFIGGTVLGEVPQPLVAFGSEAIKSSPAAAAGLAAATAATPLANELATPLAPIPVIGPGAAGLARLGIPLIAGGIAAAGTRYAEDQGLPKILPEDVARSYTESGEAAAENPLSALAGQLAGQSLFFRPGLPVGTTGASRGTIPLITGGIGAGIEGAHQLSEGQFDPQKLALATLGSALMNRETELGASLGPRAALPGGSPPPLRLPNGTDVPPAELTRIAQVMNEPRLPQPTSVAPSELGAIGNARLQSIAEGMAGAQPGEAEIRGLAERMAGKTPEQQLAVISQETKLQKDVLTPDQERAALDAKQALQNQVDAQRQAEAIQKQQQDAADAQQKAVEDQAKAVADAQKQAQDQAAQAAEVPKSTQILMDGAKPPPLANVATEAATQTKESPFALQAKLNELTGHAPADPQQLKPTPSAEYAGFQEGADAGTGFHLYTLKEPIPGHPEGSTVTQDTLREEGFDTSKLPMPEEGASARDQLGAQRDREQIAHELELITGTELGAASNPNAPTKLSAKDILFELADDRSHGDDYLGDAAGEIHREMKESGNDMNRRLTRSEAQELIKSVQDRAARFDDEENSIQLENQKTIPPPPKPPDFARATPEEVNQWHEDVRSYDKNIDVAILGEAAAKEHRRLTRIADSPNYSAGDPKVIAAMNRLAEIEGGLTKEQQDVFYGMNLPKDHIGSEQAGEIARSVNDIATSDTAAELARSASKSIQAGLRAASRNEPLSPIAAQIFERVLRRAKEIGANPQELVSEYFRYRSKFEGEDVFELAGTTPEQLARFLREATEKGEPKNALQEPSTRSLLQRPPEGAGEAGGQRVRVEPSEQGTQAPEARPAGNEARSQESEEPALIPPSRMKRADLRSELERAGITELNGTPLADLPPNKLMAAVGRLRSQRGAISPRVLAPAAGGAVGAAYGATQGDSPEERLRNAILYGSLGLGLGATTSAIGAKLFRAPIRNYKTPVLKDVAQMLTPKSKDSSLFQSVVDAANNFRYRFNTRFAPIGHAQRELFKATGREFTPGRYYDLERSFERLAGAPVQAEGEVERLQGVVDKLPRDAVQHFDTYLTLARIKDRLVKTDEENAALSDAVGRAQAEHDLAAQKHAANPGIRTSESLVARTRELNQAVDKFNENYNRKRVGDWSIAKADQGLAELQQAVGPQNFAKLQQAGQEFQGVMQRALDIQVNSGRMTPDLRDRVLASNDFYAPFKVLKHFEDEEGFVKGAGTQRIPSSEQLAKKITGIDDNDVRIGSPTTTAAEQVYKGYILAQKNRKLREFATLAKIDPKGDFVKPLAPGMEPRTGYDAVTYFQGGEPKRLEVSRKIADSLNGLNANETDVVIKSLGPFSHVFKLGATGLNIPFNLANALVFDPARLATISRYGFRGPQDFAYTLYEWPRALFSAARGNIGQALGATPGDLYERWIKSGAAGSTLARVMTPEAFASRLPHDMGAGEVMAQANFLRTPIKAAALVSNTLEETTKLLGLQRAMRIERLDNLSPADRAKKMAEIVTEIRNYAGSPDFARSGVSMKPLNIVLPFLNARWQGFINDFARVNPFRQGNLGDAGAAWARLGTTVAIPSVALALYNRSTPENDRDFHQIPQQERDQYFHIPINAGPDGKPTILNTGKGYYFKNKDGVEVRGYYRIPKREFPGLMASTVDDFVDYLQKNSPMSFKQFAANFADNAAQTASPIGLQGHTAEERELSAASGLNPAIRVPLEVALNKNLFTGRSIVPDSRTKASPELQYTEQTPEGYKKAAGFVPDFLPDSLRSPAKLQHITEGFTGGFSRQFVSPKLSEGNPAGTSSPLLGRFYRSERIEEAPLLDAAKQAETQRADQRITGQELAHKFAETILAKQTPEEKQQALEDTLRAGVLDQEQLNYLKEDLMDATRGLNYEDRVVKRSFSAAGGVRAKFYLDKIASLPVTERAAYLQDQARKGLLTKEVGAQLQQMVQRK